MRSGVHGMRSVTGFHSRVAVQTGVFHFARHPMRAAGSSATELSASQRCRAPKLLRGLPWQAYHG